MGGVNRGSNVVKKTGETVFGDLVPGDMFIFHLGLRDDSNFSKTYLLKKLSAKVFYTEFSGTKLSGAEFSGVEDKELITAVFLSSGNFACVPDDQPVIKIY